MTLLLVYVFGALSISFLCSVLEATLLSARRVELNQRRDAGDKGAALLLDLKESRLEHAIGSILILNTIAHTVGATLAGDQAGKVFSDALSVKIFAAVFTLAILIATEIIPKTIGTVYASRLVGPVARIVQALTWLLHFPLIITRFLTRLIAPGGKRETISRAELAAALAMATRDGTLGTADSRLMTNVLNSNEIKVDDVMTPRTVVTMLPVTTSIDAFLNDENARIYSRIPVYDGERDKVMGYVLQRDVLIDAADGKRNGQTLDVYVRPALFIPEGQPVGKVLRRLIEQREHMALVTDEYGGIAGVVTLEDLVETTLGVEILDESDQVADLRAEAIKLREQRLTSMKKWRRDLAKVTDGPQPDKPGPDTPA